MAGNWPSRSALEAPGLNGHARDQDGTHYIGRIEPTPKGIREGRDEVLDAAVKYLDAELKK